MTKEQILDELYHIDKELEIMEDENNEVYFQLEIRKYQLEKLLEALSAM